MGADGLRRGEIDLKLGRAEPATEGLRTRLLFRESLVCVVRRGHAATRGRLTPVRYAAFDHLLVVAMTHAAAASPNLTYACDTHYPWQTEQDEIVEGGRIQFPEGAVRIPDLPGLGVELDYDQVARGRERYGKIPYRKRDDEAEMRRHVDPDWKRILPRW